MIIERDFTFSSKFYDLTMSTCGVIDAKGVTLSIIVSKTAPLDDWWFYWIPNNGVCYDIEEIGIVTSSIFFSMAFGLRFSGKAKKSPVT